MSAEVWENRQGCNSCIHYSRILGDLQRRTERASELFAASGGLNTFEYAFALTESVLEALDEALLYPKFEVLEVLRGVLEIEEKQQY